MPTIAAINARCATLPPRGQLSPAELRAANEVWVTPLAREAANFQTLLNTQTSEMVNSALRGMGSVAGYGGIAGQADAAVRQLTLAQAGAASHAAAALNGLNGAAWQEAANSFGLAGGTAVAGGVRQALEMLSAVERTQSPSASMATSLASVVANAARIALPRPGFSPYPVPTIHIRREPRILPAEPKPSAPDNHRLRTSRIGRPRGSYDWYPEHIVQTYEQLACSGRYVTQERLAQELGVTLRTVQRWITEENMDLGWPPTL